MWLPSLPLSPDSIYIAVSGFYGQILIYEYKYETSSLTLYATAETGNKRTKALAFSPDGSMLAATWKGGTIQLWSIPNGCDDQSCELVLLPVSMSHGGTWDLSLAFWPHIDSDGTTKIVSGTDSGMVKVWTIDDPHGTPIVTVQSVPSGGVRSLDWSPDGSMIVAGGNDDITVYDADTLEIRFQALNAHSGRVNDVAFFSATDGLKIASGGNDGALKLWQVPEPSAGCLVDSDCDDFNQCTADACVASVCQHPPDSEVITCDGGICCGGSCRTATCADDSDCTDSDACNGMIDTCMNAGTCIAVCSHKFPMCSLSGADGCCGPLCDDGYDLDCACIPTHSKEKGPRCRDGIDNDCDELVDDADPDC